MILQSVSIYILSGLLFLLFSYYVIFICLKRGIDNKSIDLDAILKQLKQYCLSEGNGPVILEIIGKITEAPTYSLYKWEHEFNHYKLISVRLKTVSKMDIRPSYSGLIPYTQKGFQPPRILGLNPVLMEDVCWINGEVPTINLSLRGGHWLIRIGPASYPNKGTIQSFRRIIDELNQ